MGTGAGKQRYPSAGSDGARSELGASRRGWLGSGPACTIPGWGRTAAFPCFLCEDALQPACRAGSDPRGGRRCSGRLSPPVPLTIPRERVEMLSFNSPMESLGCSQRARSGVAGCCGHAALGGSG